MSNLEICDKLRFLQTDICTNNESNLCKELELKIRSEKCPPCPTVNLTNVYMPKSPPPGCGVGIFVSKG